MGVASREIKMQPRQDLNLRPLGYEYCEKNAFHQYLCCLEESGANSPAVGCQLTYLLFVKRLDGLHTLEERKAARIQQAIEKPTFTAQQDHLL